MTDFNDPSQYWQPPIPPPPPRRKHVGRNVTLLVSGAVLVIAIIAVAASSSGKPKESGQRDSSTTPIDKVTSTSAPATSTTSEAPPPPVAHADGTFTGTCDYELSDEFSEQHAGDLNGEIDVSNTGNVGMVVKVTITWPQLGHTPITMSKNVRVAYDKDKSVPFTMPASQSVIERLQSWQEGHDFDDGCTYKGKATDTFGTVH